MITVTELQEQLAEQERRRQQAAARQAAPALVTSIPSVTTAGGQPAPRYGAPPVALKGAEPDVTKPGKGKRLPPVPKPEPEHIAWAKRVMGDGYQASVKDRVDAGRILDAAGLRADDFHGGLEPDSAPPGARAVAAARLAREQAEADRTAPKAYQDRGISLGPGEGVTPGHLRPESVDRTYLEQGHAAESPQAEAPRLNPMPGMVHYVMPDMPRAAAIPPAVIAHYTGG